MPLGIKKLSYDAILPTRGSDGSVGYDLYSNEDAIVPCQAGNALVGTGLAVMVALLLVQDWLLSIVLMWVQV